MRKTRIDVERYHGDGDLMWGILEGFQAMLDIQEPYPLALSI